MLGSCRGAVITAVFLDLSDNKLCLKLYNPNPAPELSPAAGKPFLAMYSILCMHLDCWDCWHGGSRCLSSGWPTRGRHSTYRFLRCIRGYHKSCLCV